MLAADRLGFRRYGSGRARLPMTMGSGAKVLLALARDAATQQAVLPSAKFTQPGTGRGAPAVERKAWPNTEAWVASVSAPSCRDSRGLVCSRRDIASADHRPDRPAPGRALGPHRLHLRGRSRRGFRSGVRAYVGSGSPPCCSPWSTGSKPPVRSSWPMTSTDWTTVTSLKAEANGLAHQSVLQFFF